MGIELGGDGGAKDRYCVRYGQSIEDLGEEPETMSRSALRAARRGSRDRSAWSSSIGLTADGCECTPLFSISRLGRTRPASSESLRLRFVRNALAVRVLRRG
jgi:hypothetical protein